MRKFLLSIFLIVLSPMASLAATYYVDKDSIGGACSNSNAGTLITAPWCTLIKAGTTATLGDTVYIRAGIYQETITPNSGTLGNTITFDRYQGEVVILDGAETITGWTHYSGNVYSTSIVYTPSPRFTAGMYNCSYGGGLVLQDGAKLNYCMAQNVAGVNAPGTYYINDSGSPPYTLYVYLRDIGGKGYNPSAYEMKVQKVWLGVSLGGGQDYLTLNGVTIRNYQGALNPLGSSNITVRNCKLHTHVITGVYFFNGSSNSLVEQNEIWDCGHGGIELENSDNITIRRNLFKRVNLGDGYGGNEAHISYNQTGNSSNSTIIENNIFWENGSDFASTPIAVRLEGDNIYVQHNTFYGDAGSMIFLFYDGANMTFKNNIIYEAGTTRLINILPLAVADGGHVFSNNIFYSTSPSGKFGWNGTWYDSVSAWETASSQTGNLSGDPLFVDLANKDLRVSIASPAIDAGIDAGVTVDYSGMTRPQRMGYDIGAYEAAFNMLSIGIGGGSQTITIGTGNQTLIVY